MEKQLKVLFLCTANSARSQMAEAFLRKLGGGRFAAHSAGVAPGIVNPLTLRAMAEKGYGMEGHFSKHLDRFSGRETFDYVITVCDSAARECPVFPGGGARLHWPFDDPAAATGSDEERMEKFRRVRDAIEAKIAEWVNAPPAARG